MQDGKKNVMEPVLSGEKENAWPSVGRPLLVLDHLALVQASAVFLLPLLLGARLEVHGRHALVRRRRANLGGLGAVQSWRVGAAAASRPHPLGGSRDTARNAVVHTASSSAVAVARRRRRRSGNDRDGRLADG